MMHSRVYSYLYSSSKSHQFSRHPSPLLHPFLPTFQLFLSRGERKGRAERNLGVFNRPRDITWRVRLEQNSTKYRGEGKKRGKKKERKEGGSTEVCVFRSIWCFFHDACTPDYPVTMSLAVAMQGRSVGRSIQPFELATSSSFPPDVIPFRGAYPFTEFFVHALGNFSAISFPRVFHSTRAIKFSLSPPHPRANNGSRVEFCHINFISRASSCGHPLSVVVPFRPAARGQTVRSSWKAEVSLGIVVQVILEREEFHSA